MGAGGLALIAALMFGAGTVMVVCEYRANQAKGGPEPRTIRGMLGVALVITAIIPVVIVTLQHLKGVLR